VPKTLAKFATLNQPHPKLVKNGSRLRSVRWSLFICACSKTWSRII